MNKVKNKVYHLRLDKDDTERVERLLVAYDLNSAADLFRYALAHIDRTRPGLGGQPKAKAKKEATQ